MVGLCKPCWLLWISSGDYGIMASCNYALTSKKYANLTIKITCERTLSVLRYKWDKMQINTVKLTKVHSF